MLSIQPNHDSSVIGNIRVMAVNRSSKNADAAMNLLTYLAVNRSDYQKSLLSPAYTDNIEDSYYEENKASHESYIDELTKAMATADDSEKARLSGSDSEPDGRFDSPLPLPVHDRGHSPLRFADGECAHH